MLYQVIEDGEIVESYAMPDHDDTHHITTAKRTLANGVAGLNAYSQISPENMYSAVEAYSNHLGTADNFIETNTTGTGSASANSSTHSMDLATGATAASKSDYKSKKTFTLSSKPISLNFIVSTKPVFTQGDSEFFIGLSAVYNPVIADNGGSHTDHVGFDICYAYSQVKTAVVSGNSVGEQSSTITYNTGDILTIIATSTSIRFLKNGVSIGSHALRVPVGAMYLWCSLNNDSDAVDRTASIDYINILKYT